MKISAWISTILVIVGGVVWGLIGIFNFNIVAAIFGSGVAGLVVSRIIYTLVGLSALWLIFYLCMYNPYEKVEK